MTMENLEPLRSAIRDCQHVDETDVLDALVAEAGLPLEQRKAISEYATSLINNVRAGDEPGLMEVFLAQYGLSTDEGIALMCLAEALLRVPDADTIDELIEDKIAPSSWGEHLGKSSSSLVNASTWALMLTGKVLDDEPPSGMSGILHSAVRRLGEPVIRTAVKSAMKEMGNQFVLGETIESAVSRGDAMEAKGFTYSYDMLGEAALTDRDAQGYFDAYRTSINQLSQRAKSSDTRENPGISIKLSAIHPRYEEGQKHRVMDELVQRALDLALLARHANMGLNIDAEEAERLDLSLDVIQAVLADKRLADWNGFGVVVQAYGKRASLVVDWLHALAIRLDRKIMVRLVKGAYWDSEIKRAQVQGLESFPVFTRKSATDVSYISCAKKLLSMTDRIYPQFATHNAHSVAAVLALATDKSTFEFQRLHGMGEAMHTQVLQKEGSRCRIYAPVGAHRDLLAYLVRRLLENGANSSFVNQLVDENVPAEEIAQDPFAALAQDLEKDTPHIRQPSELYAPERKNSRGFDLHDTVELAAIDNARDPFLANRWHAAPLLAIAAIGEPPITITNPADSADTVGDVAQSTLEDVDAALDSARTWSDSTGEERASILMLAADLYEQNFGELFAVLAREAGKTPMDAVAELREAVDFLRYYATQTSRLGQCQARGLVVCISPWNFPLAIFTGQIAAALAAGNAVLAKPADPTPIVAWIAVKLLHQAGVPAHVLQLLPGSGAVVGARLVSDARINGVCFTGSTATAININRSMASSVSPAAPLIAETGGLNAMVVDSTALPEQAVKDILDSAFQSAGQRCSACRLLYIQEDVADNFLAMLYGAVDELLVGHPWHHTTDLGPLINRASQRSIADYIAAASAQGRLLKQAKAPTDGYFIGPAIIKVKGIADLQKEVFGPVLHVATFEAGEIEKIVQDINNSDYGLTFGLHTRIDDRVETLTSQLKVGNMYINRNQIGAVVGSQPFGGEGLSGTGPKAGGPHYVQRFAEAAPVQGSGVKGSAVLAGSELSINTIQAAIDALPPAPRSALSTIDLPGPTGESNRLSLYPRGTILCLGPTAEDAAGQARLAQSQGCPTLSVCPNAKGNDSLDGFLKRDHLAALDNFTAVALWSDQDDLRAARKALARREGELLPLITERDMAARCVKERHVCIDTTASGGNASLLAQEPQ